jgi:hypothetical protein
MKELTLVKFIRTKSLVRRGQKAWVLSGTGACAALVVTRFKGKGRWIQCWAHWAFDGSNGKTLSGCTPDAKWVGKVQVTDGFYRQIKTVSGHWLH